MEYSTVYSSVVMVHLHYCPTNLSPSLSTYATNTTENKQVKTSHTLWEVINTTKHCQTQAFTSAPIPPIPLISPPGHHLGCTGHFHRHWWSICKHTRGTELRRKRWERQGTTRPCSTREMVMKGEEGPTTQRKRNLGKREEIALTTQKSVQLRENEQINKAGSIQEEVMERTNMHDREGKKESNEHKVNLPTERKWVGDCRDLLGK